MVVFNNWLKHTTLVKNVAINHPSDKECAGNPFEYFFFLCRKDQMVMIGS